jgi:hypothetical protein
LLPTLPFRPHHRSKISLNALAFDSTVFIIQTAIDSGVNVREVRGSVVRGSGRHAA